MKNIFQNTLDGILNILAIHGMLKLERQELLCLKSAEALDFQAIFAKIDLIEGLEQAVIRFEKLKEELF